MTVKKQKHPSFSPQREQRTVIRLEGNEDALKASRGRIARTKELVKQTSVIVKGRRSSSK